ncbi:probable polygalacturonase At3g15720 [Cucurbita maxima]|uniref:Probable polygalacturonase At3g15720 n=1 Tax=Cucurbita maxima TaxID=3661 RepID=A0A6J1J777_CUCMA|nr:probable polygalacturonase At3g15720 [Cucurbita maxima]
MNFVSWAVLASSSFNILDYGAAGNGETDDTEAFVKAWKDVCEATDGIPTLQVPVAKIYLLNPITFQGPCKSEQVNFELKGTLMAPSKDAWPSDNDKWIQFVDIDGLTINGGGKMNGQGSLWWKGCEEHCDHPTALFFHNCNGLHLQNTKHIDSAKNHISINFCDDVIVSDIHVNAPEDSPNTDGIDISRSTNVMIQNSFMLTGDDCIAINNGSSYITIKGVTCGPGHGISVGSLGEDGQFNSVENIYVSDSLLKGTQNGVRIKTWESGYGYARNITFEKITFEDVKNPIIIDQYYTSFASTRENKETGIKVSDVTYREVNGTSAGENVITFKCSEASCTNIILDHVDIQMSHPDDEPKVFCQNVIGKSKSVIPIVPCLSEF